jgi:hypothetical protein
MPRKTKKSKKSRRRTLRRKAKRGGNLAQSAAPLDRQNMDLPTAGFKSPGTPTETGANYNL